MELELEKLQLPSDQKRPFVIAGPCSAETEEQVMKTAKQLAQKGCHMFRAGVWKPRTKPGGFEGHGEPALQWLKQVKEETGMLVTTEVATPAHVELAMKYGIDIMWVGARTSANPFAMQALADALRGIDIPVFVKNPVNPDLELWIGALERLNGAGIKKLAAIHRGFTSYDKTIYRNLPMWQIPIELRRRIPDLAIICDPSHIGGRLRPRQGMERRQATGDTRCARLYPLTPRHTRRHRHHRGHQPTAQADRRARQPGDGRPRKAHARVP